MQKLNTGLQLKFDYRNAEKELIAGLSGVEIKNVDHSEQLQKTFQHWKPFCVNYMVSKLSMNTFKDQQDLSEDGLAIASNTGKSGTDFNNVLSTAKNVGFFKQADFPNFNPNEYSWDDWDRMFEFLTPELKTQARKPEKFGWWYVPTRSEVLMREIQERPIGVAIPLGESWNTNSDVKMPPSRINCWHATIIAGLDTARELFIMHDSLQNHGGRWFMPFDYPMSAAIQLTDALPPNWQEIQALALEQEFAVCLGHYGKPRDLFAEIVFAGKMASAFKKFRNESVWQAAGRFWAVYINAGVYAGYSLEDLWNDCFNWRRTGQHAFNLNKIRS